MTTSTASNSDELITQILEKQRIEEYIGRFVTLRPPNANNQMAGLCPFHKDTTASMTVSTTKGLFYCAACKETGNVIQFVEKYHNLSFPQAKAMLAQELGLKVDRDLPKPLKLLNSISQRFRRALKEHPDVLKYAMEVRKLKPETLERFGIGYCTGKEFYGSSNEETADLLKIGVLFPSREKDRKPWSLMSRRLTFTIKGANGNVIAFGGRKVDDATNGAKYVNTAESEYFSKSEVLFGMYEAAVGIHQKQFAVVVEGYMDTTILHQEGVNNTVGVMGSSASEQAFKFLWTKTKRIVFCLDPDKAGIDGTVRSIMRAAKTMRDDCRIDVVTLPGSDDPDEFVLAHGAPAFFDLCEKATPLSRFLGDQMRAREHAAGRPFSLRIPEDRTRYLTLMNEVAGEFEQAPMIQKQIASEAEAMISAFVCDAALKQRGIGASAGEIRSALLLLAQLEGVALNEHNALAHSVSPGPATAANARTVQDVQASAADAPSTPIKTLETRATEEKGSPMSSSSNSGTEYQIDGQSRPRSDNASVANLANQPTRRVTLFK